MLPHILSVRSCATSTDTCYIPRLYVDQYNDTCVHGVVQGYDSSVYTNDDEIDLFFKDGTQHVISGFSELRTDRAYNVCTHTLTSEAFDSVTSHKSVATCVQLPRADECE